MGDGRGAFPSRSRDALKEPRHQNTSWCLEFGGNRELRKIAARSVARGGRQRAFDIGGAYAGKVHVDDDVTAAFRDDAGRRGYLTSEVSTLE